MSTVQKTSSKKKRWSAQAEPKKRYRLVVIDDLAQVTRVYETPVLVEALSSRVLVDDVWVNDLRIDARYIRELCSDRHLGGSQWPTV